MWLLVNPLLLLDLSIPPFLSYSFWFPYDCTAGEQVGVNEVQGQKAYHLSHSFRQTACMTHCQKADTDTGGKRDSRRWGDCLCGRNAPPQSRVACKRTSGNMGQEEYRREHTTNRSSMRACMPRKGAELERGPFHQARVRKGGGEASSLKKKKEQ